MQEIQWTEEDLRQISDHGITRSEVEHQLELFEEGFPFHSTASVFSQRRSSEMLSRAGHQP